MKQIKIRISRDGEIQAETLGMAGKQCLKYISVVEKLADAVCDDSDFKPDYYESEETVVSAQTEEVKNI